MIDEDLTACPDLVRPRDGESAADRDLVRMNPANNAQFQKSATSGAHAAGSNAGGRTSQRQVAAVVRIARRGRSCSRVTRSTGEPMRLSFLTDWLAASRTTSVGGSSSRLSSAR